MRGSNTCGVSGCNSSGTIAACNDTSSVVFRTDNQDGDTYTCCGLTIGSFIGIIVAAVVVLVIIICILVCKYKAAR